MAYVYLKPHPNIAKLLDMPNVPIMVRDDAIKQIRAPDGGMRVDRLLDAWAQALAENAPQRIKFGWAVAPLALAVGMEKGLEGMWEVAEHYFRLGLQFAPQNLSLKARLALSLQCQREPHKVRAALVEYQEIMQDPRVTFGPQVWIMAAHAAAELGRYQEAVRILERCASYVPADNDFWDLLGEYRKRAAEPSPRPSKPSKPGPRGKAAQWERIDPDKWEPVD